MESGLRCEPYLEEFKGSVRKLGKLPVSAEKSREVNNEAVADLRKKSSELHWEGSVVCSPAQAGAWCPSALSEGDKEGEVGVCPSKSPPFSSPLVGSQWMMSRKHSKNI